MMHSFLVSFGVCLAELSREEASADELHLQVGVTKVGVSLTLLVDLDTLNARFNVNNAQGAA